MVRYALQTDEDMGMFETIRVHSGAQMERLVMTLTMCVGMESILAMKDICGLSADEAVEVKCWAASALLRATLQENADNT